jgi:hypothetical protein
MRNVHSRHHRPRSPPPDSTCRLHPETPDGSRAPRHLPHHRPRGPRSPATPRSRQRTHHQPPSPAQGPPIPAHQGDRRRNRPAPALSDRADPGRGTGPRPAESTRQPNAQLPTAPIGHRAHHLPNMRCARRRSDPYHRTASSPGRRRRRGRVGPPAAEPAGHQTARGRRARLGHRENVLPGRAPGAPAARDRAGRDQRHGGRARPTGRRLGGGRDPCARAAQLSGTARPLTTG